MFKCCVIPSPNENAVYNNISIDLQRYFKDLWFKTYRERVILKRGHEVFKKKRVENDVLLSQEELWRKKDPMHGTRTLTISP